MAESTCSVFQVCRNKWGLLCRGYANKWEAFSVCVCVGVGVCMCVCVCNAAPSSRCVQSCWPTPTMNLTGLNRWSLCRFWSIYNFHMRLKKISLMISKKGWGCWQVKKHAKHLDFVINWDPSETPPRLPPLPSSATSAPHPLSPLLVSAVTSESLRKLTWHLSRH